MKSEGQIMPAHRHRGWITGICLAAASAIFLAAMLMLCDNAPLNWNHQGIEYVAPLLDRYAVSRIDPEDLAPQDRSPGAPYSLVAVSPPFDGSDFVNYATIVANVEKIAAAGSVIVGTSARGYFLLDTGQKNPQPAFFTTTDQWKSAVATAGFALPALKEPDAIANAMPGPVTRPWDFAVFHNLLGHADYHWANFLFIAAPIISLAVGIVFRGWLLRACGLLLPLSLLLGSCAITVQEYDLIPGGILIGLAVYTSGLFLISLLGKSTRDLIVWIARRRSDQLAQA